MLLLLILTTLFDPEHSRAQEMASAEVAAMSTEGGPQAPATEGPDPVELERARRLFARGLELADEGAFGRAAQKFRDALAIYPAPAVRFNLASALFEMRRYDESYNAVSEVLHAPDVAAEVRERAQKLEQSLRARVARLTVVLGGSSEGAVVMVDGVELTAVEIGVTRALPSGRHKVEALRDGNLISAREIEIPLRTAALVDVSMIPSAEREVIREVIVSTEPEPLLAPREVESRGGWSRPALLWGSIAAVLVVGGVTAGVLLLGSDEPAQPKPVAGSLEPGVITWR